MLTSSEMIIERARTLGKKHLPAVAVAGAEDDDVLRAVCNAQGEGLVNAMLVGNTEKVKDLLTSLKFDANLFPIVDAANGKEIVTKAVDLCSSGQCQILMKGKVSTPDLMKAVLSPKAGLRRGQLLSHCAIVELSGQDKLFSFTDGGVASTPDFNQKLAITENAVYLAKRMGIADPHVAYLGVMNEADPEFPSTMEAAALARTCAVKGIATHAVGPVNMKTVFEMKPDILVGHRIEEINIIVKSLIHLRNATFMGVILGAKVPLSLVSRSDPPRNKMASLALAAVMAGEAA